LQDTIAVFPARRDGPPARVGSAGLLRVLARGRRRAPLAPWVAGVALHVALLVTSLEGQASATVPGTPATPATPATPPASAAAPAPAHDTPAIEGSSDGFGPTLDFGTGLIDDPVAWVSPRSSDFWLSYGATHMLAPPGAPGTPQHWNGNFALDTHWMRRFSVGVSLYSNNPEWGFFGQVLALRDGEIASFFPAIAVGARNIGPFGHEERYLIGSDVTVDSAGRTHEVTPPYFKNFHTAPTLYAVATKSIAINSPALSSLSLTVGGGDGLFSDDGGLGAAYDRSGTVVRGLFFGARAVTRLSSNAALALVGENNGWDWNAGVTGTWRGLTAGLYATELDKGTAVRASSLNLYNYRKWNIAFGYNGNLADVAGGHLLRTQISALEREEQELRTDVNRRERVIAKLQGRLAQLEQGEQGDATRARQEIERQLQQERDAIERANARLRHLQGETPE